MIAVIAVLTAPALAADPLVDIRSIIPDVILDVRYATAANFLQKSVYPVPVAFLRRSTAEKLSLAADLLRAQRRRLVVYDAYRPLSVQKEMWAKKPDRRYVADPARGSAHNRAAAVDVGLTDAAGRRVALPSDFDEFGPTARHAAAGVSPAARAEVEGLKRVMEGAGFRSLADEWWHYEDTEAKNWPVLDIPLRDLTP